MCAWSGRRMLVTMSGATGTSDAAGVGGFEETVKDFWLSRPRRPLHGRMIAGVAAGIGNRYGIDPIIVRVAFATATIFGGIGLACYVLAWLIFPGEHDEVSAIEALFGRGRSTMSRGFTIALAILFFPLTSWAFAGGWFHGGGVLGLAILVAGLYLLHRSRGQFNRPAPTAPAVSAAVSTPSAPAAEQASCWDPLGAAPLGWDLPDPVPPAPAPQPREPRQRRNAAIGLATFAIAMVVAGTGAALGASGITWFSPHHIIGLALGVFAVGMIAGAFLNGGRGLIAWAIPLSIAGLVTTAVPVEGYSGGFGDLNVLPRTSAEVAPVYQRTAGNIRLYLNEMTATAPISTAIRNGTGSTTVVVPTDADVRFSCQVQVGNVDCLNRHSDGVHEPAVTGVDLGPDGPGGPQINLQITEGAGSVEVRRG